VIAVDTNILVYAHRTDSEFHAPADAMVRSLADDDQRWLIPFHCFVEFYAVVTHPRLYKPPSSMERAIEFLDDVAGSPSLRIAGDESLTWSRLRSLLVSSVIVGPRAYDARIAAVCMENGVTELWSADRDYSRFPQLKVVNPLIKPS